MVTVVSRAPHASVVKQTICKNCGSTLEYTPADVVSKTYKDWDGTSDTDHTINCPTCSNQIIVSKY